MLQLFQKVPSISVQLCICKYTIDMHTACIILTFLHIRCLGNSPHGYLGLVSMLSYHVI